MATAARLSVRYDDQALKALTHQARHLRGGLGRIVPPAINRVASWSRTQIKRQVARQAKLKMRQADRLLRTTKANRAHWSASVAVENRRIAIAKFVKGRSRRRRVSAAFPSGLSQSYPRAFPATMPSGHRGIFVRARVVKPGVRIRRERRGSYRTELPIYEIRERLGRVLRLDFLQPIWREGARRLQKEIDSRLAWQLEKARRA